MVVEQKYRHRRIQPRSNAPWWIALVGCVLVSVAAQSHALPEPWSHIVSVLGAVGAGINGFLIRRP